MIIDVRPLDMFVVAASVESQPFFVLARYSYYNTASVCVCVCGYIAIRSLVLVLATAELTWFAHVNT